jgi:hypothetical protein
MLATAYDPLVRIVLLFSVVAVTAAASTASAASTLPGFRTPSGNIGCYYAPKDQGISAYLRCDIRTGLKPKPPRPPKCVDLNWGDSYEMPVKGRAVVTCHGDTAIDPTARVLRYGSTWHQGGFTCTSRRTGLKCRNGSGHGFFMSKQHSYRF